MLVSFFFSFYLFITSASLYYIDQSDSIKTILKEQNLFKIEFCNNVTNKQINK